jgi:hypothetical protein
MGMGTLPAVNAIIQHASASAPAPTGIAHLAFRRIL